MGIAKIANVLLLVGSFLKDEAAAGSFCPEDVGLYCNRTEYSGITPYEEGHVYNKDTLGPLINQYHSTRPPCDSLSNSGWHGGIAYPNADITVRGWATKDNHINICDYVIPNNNGWTCYCETVKHN